MHVCMRSVLPKKLDSLGRRSRFKRQPTGKRIVLQDRDIKIFQLLWRYRYLRADRIVSHINPRCSKRLKERLGDLFHETHHIDRPPAQWDRAKAEHIHQAYELTQFGFDALLDANPSLKLPPPAVNFSQVADRTVLQFAHALQISETLFDIEQRVTMSADQKFHVEREILTKASTKLKRPIKQTSLHVTIPISPFVPKQKKPCKTWIVPDALFAIEHKIDLKTKFRFYAIEVERKNPLRRKLLKRPSALKKLLAYQTLFKADSYKEQLSVPNMYLIMATSTPEKLLQIKQMADEIWSEAEQKFLLFVPPVEVQRLWRTGSELPPAFVEITEKWFEHFQS